jgi:predicted nuclease of predicted toxin-antitoxin system
VILWLDAQLPPALAEFLRTEFGLQAQAVRDLGLRDATDEQIFQAAQNAGAVVVTKDSDFLTLLERRGAPPQVIWLTMGNCANASLMKVFRDNWSVAADLLRRGEPLVEIGTTATGADHQ